MIFWMNFTLIILFLSIIGSVIRKHKKIISHSIFIILWFISSFRYRIGIDYDSYVGIYSLTDDSGYYMSLEPSIRYIVEVSNSLGFSFQMMFIVYTTIIMAFLYAGLRYFAENETQVLLGLTLFAFFPRCYWSSMNLIRQMAAASIMFWGMKYIIESNFKKYAICVCLATMFHFTAIIFLPIYWLKQKNNTSRVGFLIIVAFIIRLTNAIEYLTNKIMGMAPEIVQIAYARYVENTVWTNAFPIWLFFIIFTYYFYVLFVNCLHGVKEKILINLTILSIVFTCAFPSSSPLARLRDYFSYYFIMLLSASLNSISNKYKYGGISYIIVVGFALYFLYSVYNVPNMNVPYAPFSASNIDYEPNFNFFK